MARYRVGLIMAGVFALGAAAGALGLTAFQRSGGPVAHAQSAACTNASFAGTYGALGRGFSLADTGGSSAQAPLQGAAVLVVTADGAGGLTLGGSMNPIPVTGSYSVNPDCSFAVSITSPHGLTGGTDDGPALGVLVDGGRRFYVATTNPSRSEYFIGERQ